MKLRLIEGGAGSGKSRLCLEELAARQKAEPLGPPLLLLVPEQATFGSERAYVAFAAEAGAEPVGASGGGGAGRGGGELFRLISYVGG